MLTLQYPETQIQTMTDFKQIPLRSPENKETTPLESVADLKQINTPTEVDHYQLRRQFNIYVMPKAEDLSRVNAEVDTVLARTKKPGGVTIGVRGAVRDMQQSFSSFGIGLVLAIVLVYLVLMAQFASFSDPFIILLAIPPGLSGVLIFLLVTGTTLNVMSLMGIVMMTGIAVSDSMGVQLNQLITDFGRTRNLVASAQLKEKARQADANATREDIVLATDQVFYQAIEAQATLRVAQQTVDARQTLVDQVSALATAKLKSDLDLSFVQVNLSQAKLLKLNAQGNLDASKASLAAVLGYDHPVDYQLEEDSGDLPGLPANADESIKEALQNRPDLQSLGFSEQAAQKFSLAQHEQLLPTVSALGVVGYTPLGASQYFTSSWYGAVGVNISVPIFNGFRYTSHAAEASLEATAQSERTRDLRNQIVRDVRTAWLNANAELQRVTVTEELLKQSNVALSLAQTRYQLGLSSIVELSQAQLQQTQAAIDNANARSQFGLAYADLQFQTGASR